MGKPLISDATMLGMYETMQRLRAAKRDPKAVETLTKAKRTRARAQPESILAALMSQVHRRDAILMEGSDRLARISVESYFTDLNAGPCLQACPGTAAECAAFATGMALREKEAARGSGPRKVVLAVLQDLPPLAGVLRMMEQRELSLLLVVQSEPESRADAQRRLLATKIPLLPVDQADAVAVCRVTQECMLRARNGWGGAIIQAIPMPGTADPMHLLGLHLEKRGLMTADPDL